MATTNTDTAVNSFYKESVPEPKLVRLKEALDRRSVIHGKCILWTGFTNFNGYGTYRTLYKGRRINLKVHRLAYFLATSAMLDKEMHVSHRCHNKTCINIEHLSYETQGTNNSRQICKNDGNCYGHGRHPSCLIGINED